MSIIDKLDKKISAEKNKKKLKEEERDSLFKKIYDFGEKVYKKNIANDFIKLKKLFEKHIEKDDKATVNISILRVVCVLEHPYSKNPRTTIPKIFFTPEFYS